MFARFDEIPAMTLQDIKETKRNRRTHTRTFKVKTVYPPQTKFAGGGIKHGSSRNKGSISAVSGKQRGNSLATRTPKHSCNRVFSLLASFFKDNSINKIHCLSCTNQTLI